MKLAPWIGVIVVFFGALASAEELPDELRIAANFHHTSWTIEDGLPLGGDLRALAQTTDGWLWIGGQRGLLRFDGVTFEHVELGAPEKRTSDGIYFLYATRSGDLWMGHYSGNITLRRGDGHFEHFGQAEGVPATAITTMTQDASGRMWAGARGGGLLRFDGRRWHKVDTGMAFPEGPVHSTFADQHGAVWVSHEHGIFHLGAGESRFRKVERNVSPGGAGFLQTPDGRTWYIDMAGVHVLTEQASAKSRDPHVTAREWATAIFDRHGDLWTLWPKVMRIPAPVPQDVVFAKLKDIDTFTAKDGLSAPIGTTMLEDREGNIWIGTPGGLERFRRTNLHKVSFDPEVPYHVGMVAADAGAIWAGMFLGNVPGPKDGLWRYDGRLRREAAGVIPAVSAIHRSADGTLWIGTANGVWKRASNGELQKLAELPELVRNQQVHALTLDAGGDLWVSSDRGILYRLRNGVWEPFGNLTGLPRQSAQVQTLGSDGRMWFGYVDGSIAVTQGDSVKLYTSSDGLASRQVSSISVAREVIVGGEDGVVVLHDGRFHRLIVDEAMTLEGITGILQTQDGDVWLNSLRGAVRIDGRDLQRALQNGTYAVPLETFDGNDGYPGAAQQTRPKPTLSQGSDGRLWFSGTLGAGWLDPNRIYRNTVPPPVHIRSVIANDKLYGVDGSVELPKGTRDLQVSYTALSLSRPERVRFRYRLEGYESAWTDAGNRREAFFTNLPPGDYRFRVIAANESNAWNDAGASVNITLPPTFTQTRVFLALCAFAGIVVLWGVYAVRIRQVTARERGRLQERLSERLRIARELHDTLLQGVQGLILQFQAIANQGDMREQTRQSINNALDRADALLVEGRDRVKDLRSATVTPVSFRQQLLEAVDHMSAEQLATLRVIENGTLRDLQPMVREEAVRITSEAIVNALRHAAAATIEIEVSYERARLRINVRDDGRGMDESMIRSGREGHFGLLGMQERTKRIRGQIKIWSRPGAGTEVSLTVPASMAYVRRGRVQAVQVVDSSPP